MTMSDHGRHHFVRWRAKHKDVVSSDMAYYSIFWVWASLMKADMTTMAFCGALPFRV